MRGKMKFCSLENGRVADGAQNTFEGKSEGESFKISKKEMRNHVQFPCSLSFFQALSPPCTSVYSISWTYIPNLSFINMPTAFDGLFQQ